MANIKAGHAINPGLLEKQKSETGQLVKEIQTKACLSKRKKECIDPCYQANPQTDLFKRRNRLQVINLLSVVLYTTHTC